MKSSIKLFLFISLILSAWLIYDRWDAVLLTLESSKEQVSRKISSTINNEVTTTFVYKWKDSEGNWQYSNTQPENVPDAEVKKFRSDENIMPAVSPPGPASNKESKEIE